MTTELIPIEVAYAKAQVQVVKVLQCPRGVTVQEAISLSGIVSECPEIDLSKNKVGVFGKAAKLDAVLYPGDRVEIYRPLIADPKEARKKRAKEGKKLKKGSA